MEALRLILALIITCLPVWVWLNRLVPRHIVSRHTLLLGYSVVLGILLTTLCMRLLSFADIPFSIYSIGGIALLIAVTGWFVPAASGNPENPAAVHPGAAPGSATLNGIQKFIVLLCLALLAGRLLALGLEVGTRPVTGWDAKQHWARQARVFFEFGTVMPYVPAKEWLAASGDGVYTSLHHNYPVVVPLLQAWVATAFGEWHESIVGLPWLLIWCAIGLVFYSQARLAGVTTEVALAATYMVLSMPLLNIHVALAGYADSMLAATYLAAVAALHNWSRSGGAWQLLLAVTAGAGCMLIKHEGFYWMLTLLPGFILVWLGEGKGLRVLGGLFLLLPLAFLITPEEATIAGHSIAGSDLGYRPESWDPLLRSSLIHDNWHLLIYLYIAALILAPWRARANLPLAAVLLCASGLYLALFLFSRNATGAAVFTSLNRVELQLAPAIAFFTLSVAWALKRPARSEPAPAGGTAHPGNTG